MICLPPLSLIIIIMWSVILRVIFRPVEWSSGLPFRIPCLGLVVGIPMITGFFNVRRLTLQYGVVMDNRGAGSEKLPLTSYCRECWRTTRRTSLGHGSRDGACTPWSEKVTSYLYHLVKPCSMVLWWITEVQALKNFHTHRIVGD